MKRKWFALLITGLLCLNTTTAHAAWCGYEWQCSGNSSWTHTCTLANYSNYSSHSSYYRYTGNSQHSWIVMDLTARCGDQQVMMGDTLSVIPGQEIQLTVDLRKHPKGNLFVYLNGSLLDARYVDHTDPATLVIPVPDCSQPEQGYVRVEFCEIEGELPYYGYSWRNWQSLRLISNPIYFTKGV